MLINEEELEARKYFDFGLYDKDLERGKMLRYWEDGQISVEKYFEGGKRSGKLLRYNRDGSIHLNFFFQNGEKEGEQLEYYEKG